MRAITRPMSGWRCICGSYTLQANIRISGATLRIHHRRAHTTAECDDIYNVSFIDRLMLT